jgi:hypothetical protein
MRPAPTRFRERIMTTRQVEPAQREFDLLRCGKSYRLAEQFGLSAPTALGRVLKVAVLLAVTWIPLLFLSLWSGHFSGTNVRVPFLHDPEVHARLLVVLPLLELAAVVVPLSLAAQCQHLREMGVVPARERGRFDAARSDALALRESAWSEGILLALSYVMAVLIRLVLGMSEGASSWERLGTQVTPAGWWLTLVSLPILYFFLLRWLWIFLVWNHFLFWVSRLDLELTPTHPDRAGGLGFLGWGLAGFATVLLAVSTVFAAAFAEEILHHGETLDSLKYHVAAFVVAAILILHAPMLLFSRTLTRCRFQGLREFGALVWRHDREFDQKWIRGSSRPAESILGSPDIRSMAGIATCYEHINDMRLIPFDTKAFAVLAAAALLPMVPLVGTLVPVQEIFMKLAEFLI